MHALLDPRFIDIEADRVEFAGKRHGKRKSDVSETNDDNAASEIHGPNLYRLGSAATDAIIDQTRSPGLVRVVDVA